MSGIARSYRLDPRSLILFRVGLGCLLLFDLATRWGQLEAHYSDAGVLPRSLWLEWADWSTVSVHLGSGSVAWQGLLFAVAAAAAIALILGWETRLATIASWFLLMSLHARNPAILHGGDALLRILLFWAMFLPLGGGRLSSSIRPVRRARWSNAGLVAWVAGVALGLQLSFLYWFSALHKWHPAWVETGNAVELALRLDQLTTAWGASLLAFPVMLKWATWGTMALEILGPFLLWCPIATGRCRGWGVALFTGFHLLGLAPAFHLDLFPWACALAWTAFLPSGFWRKWGWRPVATRETWLASPGPRRNLRRVGTACAAFSVVSAIAIVFAWNLRNLRPERFPLPPVVDTLVEGVGLQQQWDLFAPYPSAADGWITMPGRLADGSEIDVWTGAPPTDAKPVDIARSLGPARWRKLLINLPSPRFRALRSRVGAWLCRSWNAEADEARRLEELRIVYWSEITAPDGTELPAEPVPIWRQACVEPRPSR